MDAPVKTDFALWMERMGFNGRQVSEAGAIVGIGDAGQSSRTKTGARLLSRSERLAMAALRAGLPPWSPETDQQIADVAELRRIIDEAVERLVSSRQASDD